MDNQGLLAAWPSRRRRKDQIAALHWLASKFEHDREYTEAEVNAILNEWHTFGDWALLRRELVDLGLLARTTGGRRYWLPHPKTSDEPM